MRRFFFIVVAFVVCSNFIYSQVPQITFKPSRGTILTKNDVDKVLIENELTREDQFECIIDNTVTKISDYTFFDCKEMSKLTLSENLTSIELGAFQFCKNIKKVIFPASLEEIGEYSFYGCSKLESIIFSVNSKLEIIKDGAFGESAVSEITLPKTIKRLGNAFQKCLSLKTITFLSTNPPIFSRTSGFGYEYYLGSDKVTIKVPKGTKKKYFGALENLDNGYIYKIVE